MVNDILHNYKDAFTVWHKESLKEVMNAPSNICKYPSNVNYTAA